MRVFGALMCLSMLAMSLSCKKSKDGPPPRGTMEELLANEEAFYTLRGEWDMSRAPLSFPLHLVNTIRRDDLLWKEEILVENVQNIGLTGELAYGNSVTWQFTNEPAIPGVWFIVQASTGKLRTFNSKESWVEGLTSDGVKDPNLVPASHVVRQFGQKGVLVFGRPSANSVPAATGGVRKLTTNSAALRQIE